VGSQEFGKKEKRGKGGKLVFTEEEQKMKPKVKKLIRMRGGRVIRVKGTRDRVGDAWIREYGMAKERGPDTLGLAGLFVVSLKLQRHGGDGLQ